MKEKLAYLIVILAMLLVPVQAFDLEELRPAGTVSVWQMEGWTRIRTDTGDAGEGEDLEEAYQNMKEKAMGEVFLDTAEYLILIGEHDDKETLTRYLGRNIRVCEATCEVDLKKAEQYLASHKPTMRLKDMQAGSKVQQLRWEDMEFRLS